MQRYEDRKKRDINRKDEENKVLLRKQVVSEKLCFQEHTITGILSNNIIVHFNASLVCSPTKALSSRKGDNDECSQGLVSLL